MKKLNVLIFFGGCSPEYSVSLSSASGVIMALDRERYEPITVGITKEGKWYLYTGPVSDILNDTWQNDTNCVPTVLSPNPGDRCLLLLKPTGVEKLPVDVAFPVLHGRNGEDGTIQGLIELAGIPLAGCSALSSALCMDKDRAHRLVSLAGIKTPRALVLSGARFPLAKASSDGAAAEFSLETDGQGNAASPQAASIREFVETVGFPIFVKPIKAGSSFGVTKVNAPDGLSSAISYAFQYDDHVILEEAIDGFEIGCAVLGGDELITGEIDEIELSGGFFDFTEKYTLKTSAIHVPARIDDALAQEAKETAKRIYRALACSGFARVDMFLSSKKEIIFNEVNTIPGFTEHSRYPGMMKAAGHSLSEILTKIIDLALGEEAGHGNRP